MIIRRFKNNCGGFLIQMGGTTGQNYMFQFRKFRKGFRFTICFNTDKLISTFGFNQKVLESKIIATN